MSRDEGLFAEELPRLSRGRVRLGLDRDIKAALELDADLPAAGVAALRTLADQIDQLERLLRSPGARPYDRIPLTGLVRQFDDTYDRTFAAVARAADPLTRALAEFTATEASDTEGSGLSY